MEIDEDSRNMILAIDRKGGTASTTEIRRATGLSNSSVRYRYDKLANLELIETECDDSATPENVAPVTVASLTNKCQEEIQKGLTVEAEQRRAIIEPEDNAEKIEELEQRLSVKEERLRDLEVENEYLEACVDVHRDYLSKASALPDYEGLHEEAIAVFRERMESDG